MTLMQHTGFILGYILLLGIAVGFTLGFISVEDKFVDKLDYIEDSVVANRVVRCFSEEDEFGVIDISKFNNEILENCMDEKYLFIIKLVRAENGNIDLETGTIKQERVANRYVVVDGKPAKLEIGYDKR